MRIHGSTRMVRWTARIWSIISIGLVLAFIVGEGFYPAKITPEEWLGLVFFPVGITVGMIVGWRKEFFGGIITVGSLFAFYAVHLLTSGALPKGWAWLVFAVPGFLFLVCAFWERRKTKAVI